MVTLTENTTLPTLAMGMVERSLPRVPRSLRRFAEEEIIVPTGQFKGRKFKCDRQPFTGLLFDQLDFGNWITTVITGPSQSAKSLCGFSIPFLRTVCEYKEDCGLFAPEADLHSKKFDKDILPVLNASPSLRRFIPDRGAGSKGGQVRDAIHFPGGGSALLFTRGGQDTNKAAVTLRWMFITEAAGCSQKTETSKEGGLVAQLRARLKGYPRSQQRFTMEGTVTNKDDYPWRMRGDDGDEAFISSRSRLAKPCQYCRAWVTPERGHLHGWQDAKSEDQAVNEAFWCCPNCGEELTESDRKAMCLETRLLHFGQSIDQNGEVIGQRPPVSTLWFRWNQFDNLLIPAGDIAAEEWIAAQIPEDSIERENAEMAMCQFTHCLPYQPKNMELIPLTAKDITAREQSLTRGTVPTGAKWLSRGIDCGSQRLHFVTRAWSVDENGVASGRAIDIGTMDVPSKERGVRQGLFDALCALRDSPALNSYKDANGKAYVAGWSLVDAGWMEDVVWSFMIDCKEKGIKGWMPILGRGQSAPPGTGAYSHPTHIAEGSRILWIGENCHMRRSSRYDLPFIMSNSDEWKSFVHDGYKTPFGQPGALSHFQPSTGEDEKQLKIYRNHLLAQKREWKEVHKRGRVGVWVSSGSDDHYLDSDAYSCVGGFLLGVRVATRDRTLSNKSAESPAPLTMPDGRPYMQVS